MAMAKHPFFCAYANVNTRLSAKVLRKCTANRPDLHYSLKLVNS